MLIGLIAFLVLAASVSANYWVCMDQGQILSGYYVCESECCYMCVKDNGMWTLPQYCNDAYGCSCTEHDEDLDGFPDYQDNCPNTWNRDQQDSNNNGVGDACETDYDADGYTETDCDNYDPEVYPGAPELCDGKDNNCNGQVDETKAHFSDTDCSSSVEMDEVLDYINVWKSGQADMNNLLDAITLWKGGSV